LPYWHDNIIKMISIIAVLRPIIGLFFYVFIALLCVALIVWLFCRIGNVLLREYYSYKIKNLSKSGTSPQFRNVTSQMCTQSQMESSEYKGLCKKFDIPINYRRKEWEFVYIMQALLEQDKAGPGKKGLGFGTGREPLVPIFASLGCKILATELELEEAKKKGWAKKDVDNIRLEEFVRPGCDIETLKKQVSLRFVDMKHIDKDLRDFDFVWSACSLEHLGTIALGLQFIENAMDCLKPGGIAVHTTEFNVCSDSFTVEKNKNTVIFRKRDFLQLKDRLQKKGHRIFPYNFNPGSLPHDLFIDLPPYSDKRDRAHIKLLTNLFAVSSFGIIIQKA